MSENISHMWRCYISGKLHPCPWSALSFQYIVWAYVFCVNTNDGFHCFFESLLSVSLLDILFASGLICVCPCVYACVCLCVYLSVCECACTWVCVCVCVCVCKPKHVQTKTSLILCSCQQSITELNMSHKSATVISLLDSLFYYRTLCSGKALYE